MQVEGEMASMTVWKFHTPYGADAALEKLTDLQSQQLIRVQDAAVVSWEAGKSWEAGERKPKTRELRDTTGQEAELISTNLSDEQEAKLRAAFEQED
jgi:uncharacterized membrane protein